MTERDRVAELLAGPPRVVNVGIADFAESLTAQGAQVVQVEWTPPPKLDPELEGLLEELG